MRFVPQSSPRPSAGGAGETGVVHEYVANSPLVGQIVFAQSGQPRMTTTKQYDVLNRLTAIENIAQGSAGGAPAPSFAYQYNAANQRVRANLADGSSWSYEYDTLGQVVAANHSAAAGSRIPGEQFGYAFDDIGNRQQTTETSRLNGARFQPAVYSANALNQYTARTLPDDSDPTGLQNPPETFQYNADGNLIQDARWTYFWDAENRLVAMVGSGSPGPKQLLQFAYDWQGRRIRKQVWNNPGGNGSPVVDQRFLYDGWNLIAILNSSFSLLNSFTWGLDLSGTPQGAGGVGGLLAVNDAALGMHFTAYDGNGNVAALVSSRDGTVSATYEYGAFGETSRAPGSAADSNPFRFSTKFTDDESGLLYYGYRYHDPAWGRWLSRDPKAESAGANLYAIAHNDVIGKVDFLGLLDVWFVPNARSLPGLLISGPWSQPDGFGEGYFADYGTSADSWIHLWSGPHDGGICNSIEGTLPYPNNDGYNPNAGAFSVMATSLCPRTYRLFFSISIAIQGTGWNGGGTANVWVYGRPGLSYAAPPLDLPFTQSFGVYVDVPLNWTPKTVLQYSPTISFNATSQTPYYESQSWIDCVVAYLGSKAVSRNNIYNLSAG